jgi:hypothetical protein
MILRLQKYMNTVCSPVTASDYDIAPACKRRRFGQF